MTFWCDLFVVLVLSFTSCVLGLRGESLQLHRSEQSAAVGKELRVLATTFNAKNREFDDSPDMHDLTTVMVRGHEDPGEEADIVFLGFQEFSDNGYGLGNMASEGMLWRELAKTAMGTLTADLEQAATPPGDVHEAKASLVKDLHDQYLEIQTELARFQAEYGEHASDFHSHVAKASMVNVLSNQAKEATTEVAKEIERRLKQFDAESTAYKARFADMTSAASSLRTWWDKLGQPPKSATQDAMFAKIHTWTEGSLNKIHELKGIYPNLLLSDHGARLSRAYEDSINTSKNLEMELARKDGKHGDAFRAALGAFHHGVQNAVEKREQEISRILKGDWERIGNDIKTLSRHLDNYTEDGSIRQSVAEVASEAAKKHASLLADELTAWKERKHDLLEQLLRRTSFNAKHDHVQVKMEPQRFDSGKLCAAAGAYDTLMYAYVNPFSRWKITAEPFHNEKCVKREAHSQENLGCNINNINGMECGKVVNMMVFGAEQGDKSLKVCGLNTHMSFAGKASQRMQYIAEAMEQTKKAKCDSVFFMGDFNSRVHCEVGEKQELPPFERNDSSKNSFDNLLDTFCSGDRCELKDSNLDELNQILTKDKLECYEIFKKPKPGSWTGAKIKYWDIEPTRNTVKAFGIQEAGIVDFAPTYKVKGDDQIKPGDWKRCLKDEPTCFTNDDGMGKHNPAWTDRILMKSLSESIQLTSNEYSRRHISAEFKSDHVPVTARVTVSVA
eukprot:TRINITY_DN107852_c0_g1_i1.p1 TRINITY_DN107852_c0_g1~~TRINITY_DN107852_c0_g1_i1.p1  ORF type:complete len:730 (+),score=139.94 TRINITY_DN107852_c0_g1_i1:63-2252(+)